MDYQRHYNALIDRARSREVIGYVERHHVVPKCMGGSDDKSNLVSLTPEEHFVAHQLLTKMHPDNQKLIFAAWGMTQGKWRNNKKFGWLRKKRAEAQRGIKLSEEAKKKISESRTGTKLSVDAARKLHEARKLAGTSQETRIKLSAALTGKPKTESHKKSLAEARKKINYTPELREKLAANKGKPQNDKQKAALLLANKGRPLTDEHKRKVSEANKGKVRQKVLCPHCGKEGGDGIMKRWHFDNCKEKTNGPNQ
jgi:hypothetical protein